MVEGAPLLREYTRNGIVGSNPIFSAISISRIRSPIAQHRTQVRLLGNITWHATFRLAVSFKFPQRDRAESSSNVVPNVVSKEVRQNHSGYVRRFGTVGRADFELSATSDLYGKEYNWRSILN